MKSLITTIMLLFLLGATIAVGVGDGILAAFIFFIVAVMFFGFVIGLADALLGLLKRPPAD